MALVRRPFSATWPGGVPSVASSPTHGQQVIAVLTTAEMLIAAVTGSSISLILVAVLVVWSRFSTYVPARASEFMTEIVEPQGALAVVITLVAVAIAAGVVLGAVRLNRFTLVRDGSVLRNRRGLLGKQTADHLRRAGSGRSGRRGVLAHAARLLQLAGRGRRNRAGQRQSANALPLGADRSCRILGPAGPARTTVAESALAGSSGTCAPPLSHGAARICRGFHRAGAVPARLVGAVGCSPGTVGLRTRRRPGARGRMAG